MGREEFQRQVDDQITASEEAIKKNAELNDKLLKLKIDIGEAEPRPLVAGVAKYYTPEEIMGKTIVVVSNLQPATIRGAESRGMLLAAKFGKELRLVTVDGDVPAGADIG